MSKKIVKRYRPKQTIMNNSILKKRSKGMQPSKKRSRTINSSINRSKSVQTDPKLSFPKSSGRKRSKPIKNGHFPSHFGRF